MLPPISLTSEVHMPRAHLLGVWQLARLRSSSAPTSLQNGVRLCAAGSASSLVLSCSSSGAFSASKSTAAASSSVRESWESSCTTCSKSGLSHCRQLPLSVPSCVGYRTCKSTAAGSSSVSTS